MDRVLKKLEATDKYIAMSTIYVNALVEQLTSCLKGCQPYR